MAKSKKAAQEKVVLEATVRDVFGKKLKKSRIEGLLPANIYGTDFKSLPLFVTIKKFMPVYKIVHETGVVYINTGKEEIPALITLIQRHPLRNTLIHVDFRKVDLNKKVVAEVPVNVVGESMAVKSKGGVLLTQSGHLAVEALPQDMPQHIDIDISGITELGTEVKVKDIKTAGNYVIKEDAEKVVISVIEHKEESITPETAPTVAPEVITEKPAEGEETPAEPAKAEPAKEEKK